MNIKQITEELSKYINENQNEVDLNKLRATKFPSVFEIVEDEKVVGELEFPEIDFEVQNAIEEKELAYYRHGEYDNEFDPNNIEIEDLTINKIDIQEYDELNDCYFIQVEYTATVNGEKETSTVDVEAAEPHIIKK